MKILFTAHSSVHPRQQIHYHAFSKFADVVVVMPRIWTIGLTPRDAQIVEGLKLKTYLLPTTNVNDWWTAFYFGFEQVLEREKPDWVLCYEEPLSTFTYQIYLLKERFKFKFLVFSWENLNYAISEPWCTFYRKVLLGCDLFQVGNKECLELWKERVPEVSKKSFILAQSGINTEIFRPLDMKKEYDMIFLGNHIHPNKGCALVDLAAKELNLKLIDVGEGPYRFAFSSKSTGYGYYLDNPKYYNFARTAVAHSMDTPRWKEQFANFFSIESIACGLPVVNSDTSAFKEFLEPLNGSCVFLTQQGNYELFKKNIKKALNVTKDEIKEGREFVKKNFSCEVIANELIKNLRR